MYPYRSGCIGLIQPSLYTWRILRCTVVAFFGKGWALGAIAWIPLFRGFREDPCQSPPGSALSKKLEERAAGSSPSLMSWHVGVLSETLSGSGCRFLSVACKPLVPSCSQPAPPCGRENAPVVRFFYGHLHSLDINFYFCTIPSCGHCMIVLYCRYILPKVLNKPPHLDPEFPYNSGSSAITQFPQTPP